MKKVLTFSFLFCILVSCNGGSSGGGDGIKGYDLTGKWVDAAPFVQCFNSAGDKVSESYLDNVSDYELTVEGNYAFMTVTDSISNYVIIDMKVEAYPDQQKIKLYNQNVGTVSSGSLAIRYEFPNLVDIDHWEATYAQGDSLSDVELSFLKVSEDVMAMRYPYVETSSINCFAYYIRK